MVEWTGQNVHMAQKLLAFEAFPVQMLETMPGW
jgi:hypothetical protein